MVGRRAAVGLSFVTLVPFETLLQSHYQSSLLTSFPDDERRPLWGTWHCQRIFSSGDHTHTHTPVFSTKQPQSALSYTSYTTFQVLDFPQWKSLARALMVALSQEEAPAGPERGERREDDYHHVSGDPR